MTRILLASAMICLSACSPEGEVPPMAKTSPPAMTPPPRLPAATPPKPETRSSPDSVSTSKPETKPPRDFVPAAPAQSFAPTPGAHLPAFTFRTMDGGKVMVQINGADLSTTPSLWSITGSFKAEKLNLGGAWPPDGARFVGKTEHPEQPASWAEVYVIDRPDRLAQIAPLRKGECLLVVKGMLDGAPIGGPLRLYVEGYRYIDYTPLVTPDGDEASRFARTIWFERISDE